MDLKLTNHGTLRMHQRNFSLNEISYVYEYGHMEYRKGIIFYFLGKKNIPIADRETAWARRLIGTTMLVCPKNKVVITIYKDQNGLKQIKKFSKLNGKKQQK